MISALITAAALLALPPAEQYVGSRYGQCPDASILEMAIYDPAPDDPDAVIIVYKRGDHALAMLDSRTKMVTLASGLKLSLEAMQARYPTPCDLPDGASL